MATRKRKPLASLHVPPGEGFDESNTAPCGKGHRCAFMQAALDAKKSFETVITPFGSSSTAIVFRREKRQKPMFLNFCPWCGESV